MDAQGKLTLTITPLACAIYSRSDTAILKLLISYKADVNEPIRSINGLVFTSLVSVAIRNEKEEALKCLLKSKADANSIAYKTETSLSLACALDKTNMIKHLVKFNADINKVDSAGCALTTAIARNHRQSVETLLELKADPNISNSTGLSPISLAAEGSSFHHQYLRLLAEAKADVNSVDNNGNTALHKAAYFGNVNAVKTLIELKATIDQPNNNGHTPIAVVGHNPKTVPLARKTILTLLGQKKINDENESDTTSGKKRSREEDKDNDGDDAANSHKQAKHTTTCRR